MAKNPRWTKLRGNIYWFQMAVPRVLRRKYGKATIQENLRTSDRSIAEQLAFQRAAYWKREFDLDRCALPPDEESPQEAYISTKRDIEWLRTKYSAKSDQEEMVDIYFDRIVEGELKKQGVLDTSELDDTKISPAVQARFRAINDAQAGLKAIPKVYRAPFSDVVKRYIDERQFHQTDRLSAQTVAQLEAVFRLFGHHIDDASFASVDRSIAAAFFDRVRRLDRNWGRWQGARTMSLPQLLVRSAGTSSPLSPRTINRYVSALSTLWDWALTRGEVEGSNPFSGHWQRVRRNRNANRPWSEEAIKRYFAAYPDKSVPGNPDPIYWLPRIALLSGMRLDEICSLETSNIRTAKGVRYFDIVQGKTDAAVRVVPVHSNLTPLLKLVPKSGYLFPDLPPGGPDQKRSWNIGKQLGRRFKQIDGASTFHAFRKNVTQTFERKRIAETEVAQIIGHGRRNITYGVYSPHGLRIDQKKELIELLHIPQGRARSTREV